ncbi:MAG: hypothetical protein US31_C0011G0041 [Berkelbacteria bacterium GW2011_GWA1_36_9]|uniref:Uncharacterized protein n=1 Tax=Berkelbacteria bacterium GW2011_GWA1_36_9 TaxID=1618331 RepID=A0A0G0I1A8_9BACT|nr:MAG: hypothetical protein US31_C0011G0041 [Berkelbacteria bacterium GW2011_GWA1_36_9]
MSEANFAGQTIFMNINFNKLLAKSYILETTPSAVGLYRYLAIAFGIFILTAFILIVKSKNKEEIWKSLYAKIINLLIFSGAFGLMLIFFRFEGIPYLGSRLFLLVLLLGLIIWSATIIWYRFKILPKKIKEYQKRKAFEKYLP